MFVEELLTYKSVSVVGLSKNSGKTECLNYILGRSVGSDKRMAITSIGIDGEEQDQVTRTAKPEIVISPGTIFITSEKHYHQKRLVAEVLDVSTRHTALGRLVTARAITPGRVLLSGPSDTKSLKRTIDDMCQYSVDITLVDGALSRLSLGSPAVTEAMVLVTGAAVSGSIPQLVKRTKYVHDLIQLESVSREIEEKLSSIEEGIWAIDSDGEIHDLEIASAFLIENYRDKLFCYGDMLYVAGAISDKLLSFLTAEKGKPLTLVVRDFTKIFASPEVYYRYVDRGGRVFVLLKNRLIALCFNPFSPDGFTLDSIKLRGELEESLNIPVYNVREMI